LPEERESICPVCDRYRIAVDVESVVAQSALMTKHPDEPSAQIEVIPAAAEQESVLGNLLELYTHDFSELRDVDLGTDGRFGYKLLPLYWSDPDRHPFLVRIDGKLAGFALVKRGSEVSGNEAVWDMAEFFVLRRYRRRGFGTRVTHELWRRFPGPWEIRVMESNVLARHFWAHVLSMFTENVVHPVPFEKGGEHWKLFSFESKCVSK
jgi:predicted acetyltransferase